MESQEEEEGEDGEEGIPKTRQDWLTGDFGEPKPFLLERLVVAVVVESTVVSLSLWLFPVTDVDVNLSMLLRVDLARLVCRRPDVTTQRAAPVG